MRVDAHAAILVQLHAKPFERVLRRQKPICVTAEQSSVAPSGASRISSPNAALFTSTPVRPSRRRPDPRRGVRLSDRRVLRTLSTTP
jgi:hypothetical protein